MAKKPYERRTRPADVVTVRLEDLPGSYTLLPRYLPTRRLTDEELKALTTA